MYNLIIGAFFNFSAEIILFLSSLVDKSILLIFQAFIFQIKCLEKATSGRYGAQTNQSAEWICTVGIKTMPVYASLEREVSAETSQWVFYAGLCQYIPAFLFGYISGYIGDHHSRKWALGIPTFGLMVCCWLMFVVANYFRQHYPIILIGYVIFGIFGNIFIFTAACYAIVVHRCNLKFPNEKTPIIGEGDSNSKINQMNEAAMHKTLRLAVLQASTPFGRGFGMLFTGLLLDIVGPAKTFVLVVVVSTITLIYLVFCLEEIRPDSVDKEYMEVRTYEKKQEQSEFCKILKMPYMMMAESYYITFCKARENIGRFGRLMLILIVLALISYTFCFYLHTFLDYLYLTFSPRNFSASLYGIFCLVQYTMGALALIIILPAVIYLLRSLGTFIVNTLISIFGVVTLSLSYLVLASANNKLVVFLSLPLDMFNYWPFAGMRVIISDMVAITELGNNVHFIFPITTSILNTVKNNCHKYECTSISKFTRNVLPRMYISCKFRICTRAVRVYVNPCNLKGKCILWLAVSTTC